MTKYKVPSKNALSFAELCFHLNDGEYSMKELAELTGIVPSTCRKWLRYLRRPACKLVYICERRKSHRSGALLLIYAWGYGVPDVPAPTRCSGAEYAKKYRNNQYLRILNGTSNIQRERSA